MGTSEAVDHHCRSSGSLPQYRHAMAQYLSAKFRITPQSDRAALSTELGSDSDCSSIFGGGDSDNEDEWTAVHDDGRVLPQYSSMMSDYFNFRWAPSVTDESAYDGEVERAFWNMDTTSGEGRHRTVAGGGA